MRRKFIVGLLVVSISIIAIGGLSAHFLEPTVVGPPVAPDPAVYQDAVVQVYGADVWGFRGRFAIHTWIATKGVGEHTYNIYQVVGWQLRRSGTSVSVEQGMPDRPWFRSPPLLLHELKGVSARPLVNQIAQAVADYPFEDQYVMWPGPNSNSFTEWVARRVPDLELQLPAKAIGKSWMESYLDEL